MVSLGAGKKSSGEAWKERKVIEARKAAVQFLSEACWTGWGAGTTRGLLVDSVSGVVLGCLTVAVLEQESSL